MKAMTADGNRVHLMKFGAMGGVVRDQDVLVMARPSMNRWQACAQQRKT